MARRKETHTILVTLIFALLAPGAALASGIPVTTCLVEGPEVELKPPAPTDASGVEIKISGRWCVAGGPGLDRVETEGRNIRIHASGSIFGLTVVSGFEIVVPLGLLPAATYTVDLVLDSVDPGIASDTVPLPDLVVTPSSDSGGEFPPFARCAVGRCPGATLLVPYFEVDLGSPNGPTTLISVGNASPEPTLSRVVMWTHWGLPALAFDLLLPAHSIKSVNLREVLTSGRLPGSEADPALPDCPFPLPPLDADALASLRARLTGQADPQDGLCYSTAAPRDSMATGYVTVDVINTCADVPLYPGDDGYFQDGGTGLAGNRNALWGEIILLDGSSHRSEGLEALSLRADAEHFGPDGNRVAHTFYSFPYFDNRVPLGDAYRTRFVNTSSLDATTDLLVWTHGQRSSRYPTVTPLDCGESPQETIFNLGLRNEAASSELETVELASALRSQRLSLEELEAFANRPFGTLDLCTKNRRSGGLLSPPTAVFQAWVAPILRIRGRLSVAHPATQLEQHPTSCY